MRILTEGEMKGKGERMMGGRGNFLVHVEEEGITEICMRGVNLCMFVVDLTLNTQHAAALFCL
jgi:hypothetical protein